MERLTVSPSDRQAWPARASDRLAPDRVRQQERGVWTHADSLRGIWTHADPWLSDRVNTLRGARPEPGDNR